MMSALVVADADGRKRGADVREMTGEQLEALGVRREPVLAAIRAKCLDCCCGQTSEVAACTVTSCALWPYRFNHNPFRSAREMTEEQRQAGADRLAKARAARAA
jgi:hypothetical protein